MAAKANFLNHKSDCSVLAVQRTASRLHSMADRARQNCPSILVGVLSNVALGMFPRPGLDFPPLRWPAQCVHQEGLSALDKTVPLRSPASCVLMLALTHGTHCASACPLHAWQVCLCDTCVPGSPQEGLRSPRTGMTNGLKQPCGC